ncbi:MAG: hypothetical protein Q8L05_05310, partial [Actinomycetota bacterium]|nr:hypothetical protein [Actinomycetota bacterium]
MTFNRRTGVFSRVISGAAMIVALLFSGSAIATAVPSIPSSSSSAAKLPAEVAGFRASMSTQLDSYFKEYGDRLSASERREMTALQSQVDRALLALQAKTLITAR